VTYAAGGASGGNANGTNPGDGGASTGVGVAASGGNGANGAVIISYVTGLLNATGGTKTSSGGNTIHTFTSSGTFTVTSFGSLVLAQGSFATTGFATVFSVGHLITIVSGPYALAGQALSFVSPLWTRGTKSTSAFTNATKDASSWANGTKHTSSFSNSTKS
jgi:hypothetical protein